MKKSILAIAVASMAASSAAIAEPTVYGNIHITLHEFDTYDNGPDLNSNTSAIGVKGSEDLGNGMKAIYKAEFQMDTTDDQGGGNALTQRDVFAGIKGGFGTIKTGIFSSNYKQMGGKVDALYRTPAEGRGFIRTQANYLHSGRGDNRGRMTNALSYTTPTMGGFSLVANTTFNNNADETFGVGVRWNSKAIMAYADWIDTVPGDDSVSTNATESAIKVGGKFSAKAFFVGAQYEMAEDVTGNDYIHVNGGFLINANNIITATVGSATHIDNDALDTSSFALAYDHKLSKMTDVYVAYMDKSSDTVAREDSAWALGIRKKF